MNISFNRYEPNENIPVNNYIKNKKLAKYYNRETMSAMVSVGTLLKDFSLNSETPFFYATGIVEHEEYELDKIATASVNETGVFDTKLFIEKGMPSISPLTQFKVLYNMTLCFVSIEYGLKGENAAIYSSASGLLTNALYAHAHSKILIGAGKIYANGAVETGFALVSKSEIQNSSFLFSNHEAIEFFKANLKES